MTFAYLYPMKRPVAKYLSILSLAFLLLVFSCNEDMPVKAPSSNPLANLPKDTGGVHKAVLLGADGSPYGYYLYTPSGYSSTGPRFPLLVFLHGYGEIGNSSSTPAALDKILVAGPPRLIKKGTWTPEFPMIVASAQCHDGWWDANKVKKFIEFVRSTYQVDTTRVYLTGLSMGGYGTYDQLTLFGANAHLAAAVVIAGAVNVSTDKVKKASQIPLWAFHGEDDLTVLPGYSKAIVKAINDLKPEVPAKLTLYPGVGHDSWTKTYDGTGMGKEDPAYDPFSMDIYSWMLQYSKK
jgi:predicted peptidase